MATLKEHQAAMVNLLANGSGIPASASRLAHAMHDVLATMSGAPVEVHLPAKVYNKDMRANVLRFSEVVEALTEAGCAVVHADGYRADATTPGLNDKAISKREKALKTDSPAKWPTPAEHRVKELENTIRQLKANNAKLKKDVQDLRGSKMLTVGDLFGAEQAGCCKEDTQVCEHDYDYDYYPDGITCLKCGHRK